MNKKQIVIISSMILILTLSLTVLAQQQFKLIINGKEVKTDMIVKDGVTYLPLRTISNELGLGLEFANGNVILNSTSSTTSPSLPQTTVTPPQVVVPSNPSTVNPPVINANGKYKYSDSPLSMEEILKGGQKRKSQRIETYKNMGYKVTIEEDVTYLDEGSYGFGCTYTLKLDDGVESEWKKINIYVIDPVSWRYYIHDEPIPMEKTGIDSIKTITLKTEKK